jgi:hypothetical protein
MQGSDSPVKPAAIRLPIPFILAISCNHISENSLSIRKDALDPEQGAAFGLALIASKDQLTLATVNDDTNTLDERAIDA